MFNKLGNLVTKAAFAFGLAFGGITLGSHLFCRWLFGNPQTPPRETMAIVAVLTKDEVKILATERKVDHGGSSGTVETTDSQASLALAEELSTVLPEEEVLVVATESQVAHGGSSGTVETLDSQASLPIEGLEAILQEIKTKKDLVKATEAEYAKLSSKVK